MTHLDIAPFCRDEDAVAVVTLGADVMTDGITLATAGDVNGTLKADDEMEDEAGLEPNWDGNGTLVTDDNGDGVAEDAGDDVLTACEARSTSDDGGGALGGPIPSRWSGLTPEPELLSNLTWTLGSGGTFMSARIGKGDFSTCFVGASSNGCNVALASLLAELTPKSSCCVAVFLLAYHIHGKNLLYICLVDVQEHIHTCQHLVAGIQNHPTCEFRKIFSK